MFLPMKRMVKTASSFAVYNLSEKLDIRKPKVTPKSLAACPTGTNPMAVVTPSFRFHFFNSSPICYNKIAELCGYPMLVKQ